MPIYFRKPEPKREPVWRKGSRVEDVWNALASKLGSPEPDPLGIVNPAGMAVSGVMSPITFGRLASLRRVLKPLMEDIQNVYYAQTGKAYKTPKFLEAILRSSLGKSTAAVPEQDLQKLLGLRLDPTIDKSGVAAYVLHKKPQEIVYRRSGLLQDYVFGLPPKVQRIIGEALQTPGLTLRGVPKNEQEVLRHFLGSRKGPDPSGYFKSARETVLPGRITRHELGHVSDVIDPAHSEARETFADLYSFLSTRTSPKQDQALMDLAKEHLAWPRISTREYKSSLEKLMETTQRPLGVLR